MNCKKKTKAELIKEVEDLRDRNFGLCAKISNKKAEIQELSAKYHQIVARYDKMKAELARLETSERCVINLKADLDVWEKVCFVLAIGCVVFATLYILK